MNNHLFTVVVMGDTGVGKTNILHRYVHNSYNENLTLTMGAYFSMKTVQWDPKTEVRLQLWDLAGVERFRNITQEYFKWAQGALVVFDPSDCRTLESAAQWKRDLDSKVSQDNGQPIPALLLANKCDRMDQSKRDSMAPSLDEFCKSNRFTGWFETSAKKDINIKEAMSFLIDQMMFNISDEVNKDVIKLEERSGQGSTCW